MKKSYGSHLIFWLFGFLAIQAVSGQNSIMPGHVRVDNTFFHIGVLWELEGDINLNSKFTIEYRLPFGGDWESGALPMRAHPGIEVSGEQLDLNYWAGSVLFLKPGVEYEIRLTLTDPDGGGTTRTIKAATKKKQQPSESGARYYVKPGAIFHLSTGKFRPFAVRVSGKEGSPIVFSGPDDKSAIIDGGDTSKGIITLGDYEGTYGYLIIENLTIQNGRWGVDAQNTHHITFRRNWVRDVDWGYINRRENGLEHDQTISDNTITGRTSWPDIEVPDERGINLIGNNNIVCYNSISYFGDGISTDSYPYGVSFSLDIYHNDISYCIDDLIEVDGTVSNTRIWRNRLYNGRMGVSVAPIMGGPCYVFRNELYELVPGSMMDDWDFNAYTSERSGTEDEPWFKWNNMRYAELRDLQEGAKIELHGVQIEYEDLSKADLPATYENGVAPGSRNLTLTVGCAAIDAGDELANINDPFVTDGSPDCGAFEYGEAEPHYGPKCSLSANSP
jgi:hypothetical protein